MEWAPVVILIVLSVAVPKSLGRSAGSIQALGSNGRHLLARFGDESPRPEAHPRINSKVEMSARI